MLNNPYADNHYTLVQPLGICPRWSGRESEYCEIISECALPELPERFENGPFFFFVAVSNEYNHNNHING